MEKIGFIYLIKYLSFFVSDIETFHSEFTFKVSLAVEERSNSQKFVMKHCHWSFLSYVDRSSSDYLGLFLERKDRAEDLTVKLNYSFKMISSTDKTHDIDQKLSRDTFLPDQGWGHQKYVKLSDLKDKNKGLMTNGNITVQLDATFVE